MSSLINLNVDNNGLSSVPVYLLRRKPEFVKQDNRAYQRFQCELPMTCKYYIIEDFTDEFKTQDCIAYNYSVNGLYFETTNPLQTELPVYIQIKNGFPAIPGSEVYGGHHAEVVWCEKKNDKTDSYYGIGVQFFEPLINSREVIH